MRHLVLAVLVLLGAVVPSAASAAPQSTLKHPCSNRGLSFHFSVSYSGDSSCTEARALVRFATDDETRSPRRVVRAPHATWRCRTEKRREAYDVLASEKRTTCRLNDGRYKATVRFFE